MHTLRLTQYSVCENQYKVEITLEGGQVRQSAVSEFEFSLTPQDQESIRWYLEDYPLYRHDPAPKIADRVEKRMSDIGRELFKHVFQSSDDARDIWADLRREVNSARVEIVTELREATAIPWELLRDPKTGTCLALHAAAFVHSNFQPARPFQEVESGAGPIRILLAICRPGGRNDVPFRSVASQLIKGLADADRDLFQLDVLRPATFDALGMKLRKAKDAGVPFHIVHFDGHGAFIEIDSLIKDMKQKNEERIKGSWKWKLLSKIGFASDHRSDTAKTLYPKGQRPGRHGYISFENPDHFENIRFVDGEEIGNLLVETDVPVLVLNACRSAHAEASEKPEDNLDDAETDPRAFGSLAQEIINEGTAGVVAMRYNIYVVTAAQFVADLYGSLIAGNPLGKAVTMGRKALSDNPVREIIGDALALQDWCVPVVYEAKAIALFPEQVAESPLKITLSDSRTSPSREHLDPDLPPTPDAGFWGRDETLLALDRAFDDHGVVLLHAYAGSGKTAAVAEFARWYALTGGVEGPVLFTSFEQYKPLVRVLDKFGQVFGPTLEQQARINWLARSDDERRDIALQVMGQVPVLWIWDNVEPVAGFPTGTESAWNADEQKELADFLRAARKTKAKFLLTSRRNEKNWLGDLPVRITLPAMPMHEREQMARGLAGKRNRKLRNLNAWRPLLRFTGGNPMTLTVLVGQALRVGLTTKEEIEEFVENLSRGETAFEDEEIEGRTKSLAASLNYGFENAFSEDERKILALLYFFQGFIDVEVLKTMGIQELNFGLPVLCNQTHEDLISLLNRTTEVGLLTSLGGGYYTIHPAIPWFFKKLFEHFYRDDLMPERAFAEAMSDQGNYYAEQYVYGNRDIIAPLSWEEHNLLHARQKARTNDWLHLVIGPMQGLRILYNHTGRRAEWKHLVQEIVPYFVNPATGGPLTGREKQWSLVTGYRVSLAREERNLVEAERLQKARTEWDRKMAAPYMEMLPEELTETEWNLIRSLAVSVEQLGHIQREMKSTTWVWAFEESLELLERIGEQAGAASCAFNIGGAYTSISALRDLEKAEQWYLRSLQLRDERDQQGRAKCLGQMGLVAFERFKEAQDNQKSNEIQQKYIDTALHHFYTALEMFPENAVNDLAVTHNQLGLLYGEIGEIDKAVQYYNQAIRYKENAGNYYGAATTRVNIADDLKDAGRLPDALDYARAALQNFEMYGDRAADMIEHTKELIQHIEDLNQEG